MSITLQTLPRTTSYSMRAVSAANMLNPAFGGARQRIGRKGSHFALDVSVPSMSAQGCGMELIADLVRGETEPIALKIPEYLPAVSYGTPLANGVSTGSILSVKGLNPSVPIRKGKLLSIIQAGQRFTYMVTAETVASAGGVAPLPIWPMLRRPTAADQVIELATPMIEGFVGAGQEWSIARIKAVGLSFSIEERE